MGKKSMRMFDLENMFLPFLFKNTIVVSGVVLKTTGCEKGKKHCGQCGYLYWAIFNDKILFILDPFKPHKLPYGPTVRKNRNCHSCLY